MIILHYIYIQQTALAYKVTYTSNVHNAVVCVIHSTSWGVNYSFTEVPYTEL